MHRWHVLFTKPRCERKVAEALTCRGIEVYLPLLGYHTRRGTYVEKAFFPRYLFARLDWQATGATAVRWTPGLTRVVTFHDQPAWLPDAKLDYMRGRMDDLDGDDFVRLKTGEAVKVTDGPFADVEAVFAGHLNDERRVTVLLDICGRQTKVEVNRDDVERLA